MDPTARAPAPRIDPLVTVGWRRQLQDGDDRAPAGEQD